MFVCVYKNSFILGGSGRTTTTVVVAVWANKHTGSCNRTNEALCGTGASGSTFVFGPVVIVVVVTMVVLLLECVCVCAPRDSLPLLRRQYAANGRTFEIPLKMFAGSFVCSLGTHKILFVRVHALLLASAIGRRRRRWGDAHSSRAAAAAAVEDEAKAGAEKASKKSTLCLA